MSDLLKRIDARTKLAGTNKLEMLLFTLGTNPASGRRETFGINVFKVREVMRIPDITQAPNMPPSVEGMVSLRGVLVPVINLMRYTGTNSSAQPEIMVVTEYNSHVQGFLVESVDTILRLDWADVKAPPDMLTLQTGGLVTAVTQLSDGRLVMLMDVEKVLAETSHIDQHELVLASLVPLADEYTIFFADDSAVARKQIERALEALHIRYRSASNGKQAWEDLQQIAARADAVKAPVRDLIQLVLTDVEMPEMDGYLLTKNIKSDPRFAGIPVVMHSSLSGASNQELGRSVGVDAYVSKFDPAKLADILTKYLGGGS